MDTASSMGIWRALVFGVWIDIGVRMDIKERMDI